MSRSCSLLRRNFLAASAGVALLGCSFAHASDSYPDRPVRVIVGYTPGGATDIIARLITSQMSEKLGVPFVVENKPGAGSNIATEEAARAKADGYTLLVSTIQNATNMSIYKGLRYDISRDFVHVGQFMASPSVLVLSPQSQIKDLQSFLAQARKAPGVHSYASTGTGGSPHLAGEMLKAYAKVDLLHVPYKGTSQALVDVSSGVVSASFMTTLGVLAHMQTGKVQPVAVAASQRLKDLPDVPTMAEAGLPNFEVMSWNGLSAPAGTPNSVVLKLSDALKEVLAKPEIQQRIQDLGGIPGKRYADSYAQYIKSETAKWKSVIDGANISQE